MEQQQQQQQYLDVMVLELNPLMPPQAFYYFPKENEIKIGAKEKALRRIFQGQVQFDEFEKGQIDKMKQYLAKHHVVIPEWWEDGHILRFLYANSFKNEKTLKTIKSHSEWRSKTLPIEYKDSIEKYLNKGVFYMHGRDHRFRPIIIIDVSKINVHEIKIEEILESMTYFFEFILKYAMLPGQIENWVVIMDLNKIGVSSLPISALKSLMTYLSSNYRSRMFATYVINTPTSIFLPWSIIKGFLEEATIQKINFAKNGTPEKLFKHTHQSQVEQKFGGTAPNASKYWPPQEISSEYLLSEESKENLFISQKQYYDLWESGKLYKNIVCQNYLHSRHNKVPMNQIHINILENSVINLSCSNLPNRSNLNIQIYNDATKSQFYKIDSAPKSQINRNREMSESISQMIKSTFNNQQQISDSKEIEKSDNKNIKESNNKDYLQNSAQKTESICLSGYQQKIEKSLEKSQKIPQQTQEQLIKYAPTQASMHKTAFNDSKSSLTYQKNAQFSILSQESQANQKPFKGSPIAIEEKNNSEISSFLSDIPNEELNIDLFKHINRNIKTNYRQGKSIMDQLNSILNSQL